MDHLQASRLSSCMSFQNARHFVVSTQFSDFLGSLAKFIPLLRVGTKLKKLSYRVRLPSHRGLM
jgi:hypothetical protein